jgi:hypothetical protein
LRVVGRVAARVRARTCVWWGCPATAPLRHVATPLRHAQTPARCAAPTNAPTHKRAPRTAALPLAAHLSKRARTFLSSSSLSCSCVSSASSSSARRSSGSTCEGEVCVFARACACAWARVQTRAWALVECCVAISCRPAVQPGGITRTTHASVAHNAATHALSHPQTSRTPSCGAGA